VLGVCSSPSGVVDVMAANLSATAAQPPTDEPR
jgi:hypothetical protein